MRRGVLFTAALALLLALLAFAQSPPRAEGLASVRGEGRTEGPYKYPFQNPALPAEELLRMLRERGLTMPLPEVGADQPNARVLRLHA